MERAAAIPRRSLYSFGQCLAALRVMLFDGGDEAYLAAPTGPPSEICSPLARHVRSFEAKQLSSEYVI